MIQGFTIIYKSTAGRSLILYNYQHTESSNTESQVQTDGRTYARNILLPIARDTVDVLSVAIFITANGIAHPRSNSFNIIGCRDTTTSGKLYRIYSNYSIVKFLIRCPWVIKMVN